MIEGSSVMVVKECKGQGGQDFRKGESYKLATLDGTLGVASLQLAASPAKVPAPNIALQDLLDNFQLIKAGSGDVFLPKPEGKWGRTFHLPGAKKTRALLAMDYLHKLRAAEIESKTKIRVKPNIGVFATERLAENFTIPIITNQLAATDPAVEIQAPCFQLNGLNFYPLKPSTKDTPASSNKPPKAEVIFDVGSAIRIVTSDHDCNAGLSALSCPLVQTYAGKAEESSTQIPCVKLSRAVKVGEEIVAKASSPLYKVPDKQQQKELKRKTGQYMATIPISKKAHTDV